MWVRKQDPAAEWQEFATPAAALRHVKSEGAPSTLQQVQIERAAKNGKPRNGLTNFIQVLGSSYCSSASSANATCMLDVFAMVPVSNVLSPFALLAPLLPRFGHSRALGNLGALG